MQRRFRERSARRRESVQSERIIPRFFFCITILELGTAMIRHDSLRLTYIRDRRKIGIESTASGDLREAARKLAAAATDSPQRRASAQS